MTKKYFYKVTNQNGKIIFNHSSNDAEKLLRMARKESKDSCGNTYCDWYFATIETNIPYED